MERMIVYAMPCYAILRPISISCPVLSCPNVTNNRCDRVGNVTKWVSVDSGPSIVAPYGTRVNALAHSNSSSSSKSAYLDLTRDDDVGSASHSTASISDNSNSSWLAEMRVGMLVDAKDMQGIWYQVSVPTDTHSMATLPHCRI